MEVAAEVLTRLGIPPSRHVDLVRTLRAVLHGFVDLELGGGFGLADPVDASFETAVDLVVQALVSSPGGAPARSRRAPTPSPGRRRPSR